MAELGAAAFRRSGSVERPDRSPADACSSSAAGVSRLSAAALASCGNADVERDSNRRPARCDPLPGGFERRPSAGDSTVGRRPASTDGTPLKRPGERDQRTNRITTTATAMTRATMAIVRVSMAQPYSVSRAVSPDPPSGTPLPLKTDRGRLERVLAGSRPDEDQASAGAPSTPSSLLHLWGKAAAPPSLPSSMRLGTAQPRARSLRGHHRAQAGGGGLNGRSPRMRTPLRAHVRVSHVCHVRPDAWRVGDRELMDELDRERIARSSRSLLDALESRWRA